MAVVVEKQDLITRKFKTCTSKVKDNLKREVKNMAAQGSEGGPIDVVDVKVQPSIFERAWVNFMCVGWGGHEDAYSFLGIDHKEGTRPKSLRGWIFGETVYRVVVRK